jgi:hypothetical protein
MSGVEAPVPAVMLSPTQATYWGMRGWAAAGAATIEPATPITEIMDLFVMVVRRQSNSETSAGSGR